jgi:hypothetical protein
MDAVNGLAQRLVVGMGTLLIAGEPVLLICFFGKTSWACHIRKVTNCIKLCALRAVLLATLQLTGPCTCAPSVLRIEDQDIVAQFAGGPN